MVDVFYSGMNCLSEKGKGREILVSCSMTEGNEGGWDTE